MSILSLLQLALTLLISVQGPNVSVEIRQQALDTAKQIVEIASIQIQSMNTQPESTPQNPPITQPAPQAPSNQSSTQTEPVLGSAIPAPFTVTVTQVISLEDGGEFFFKVEGKDGTPQNPELILDEVETNLRPGQVFSKLPPIVGTTHSYRMGITLPKADYPESPSLKVKIGNDVVETPIVIQ